LSGIKLLNHKKEAAMKPISLILLLFLAAPDIPAPGGGIHAQPLVLKIRKEDSHVGFAVTKWAVFKEEGRFRDFDGVIEFDPNNFPATKVEFTIQSASVDSRNDGRDRALRSREFFHVSQYPTLTFKSISARTVDQKTLQIEGDLTIRGRTKRISVTVTVLGINRAGRELGTLVGFEAAFIINREDFNVGEGWDIISKDAVITLHIGSATGPRTASR